MYQNLAFGCGVDSLNVLLLEENRGMRAIFTTLLKSHGIGQIRCSATTDEALGEMLDRAPHVVLTQWDLQHSDTESLIRTMRNEIMQPLCFVPVVVLCAQVSRAMIADAVDAGASAILRAPVSPKMLIERLRWITSDTRLFVREGGRYVLQPPRGAARTDDGDPAFGLVDSNAMTAHHSNSA